MTFVTAEIGTSWMGDYDVLDEMLGYLSDSDIDYVKFQCLSNELIARHTEIPYYKKASLNENNIEKVSRICSDHDIEFYSTVTYPQAVNFLDDYVKIYKVRSLDNTNYEIFNRIKQTKKKIIVSSLKPLPRERNLINLYCIPRYPVEFGEINFNVMPKFDGYSNHCKNPLAILEALRKKTNYLEFHVSPSLSKFLIDNPVSFSLAETETLMKWVRFYEYGDITYLKQE